VSELSGTYFTVGAKEVPDEPLGAALRDDMVM